MNIFPNFKCPNGAPPEECIHVQQLAINFVNMLKRKKEEAGKKLLAEDNEVTKQRATTYTNEKSGTRERTRSR